MRIREYERLMAEAKAEFDAWDKEQKKKKALQRLANLIFRPED